MKNKITKWFLPLIILLAAALRFYQLGQVPASVDWDEASNGYNAYSILKTGRDEYGKFLPLYNRSFDDYKPPMLMYLEVPSVALFGLNSFAVRLPSAILGTLTVLLVYLLTKEIFKSKKSEEVALISALFLAISPWHVQFSRAGFESNVGLFFITAAVTFFFLGLKNKKWFIASSIFFGFSLYTYHAERIIAPLLGLVLLAIYKDEVFQLPKKFIGILLVIFLAITIPLLILAPKEAILGRLEASSNDANVTLGEKSIQLIKEDAQVNSPFGFLIHNRRVVTLQEYFGNYISHFDFNFLFIRGDNNFRHHIQDMGVLYLYEIPLILIGIYSLVKNKNKDFFFILFWLLIAPVAAIPVTPTPHANRALAMVIPLEIISAYAVSRIFEQKFHYKKQIEFLTILVCIFSVLLYVHNYFVHYKIEKASFWQYGYTQAAEATQKYKDNFDNVVIDKSIEQSYIFWLFATKYDPATYQQKGSKNHFDKYFFDEKLPNDPKKLFVATTDKFPEGFEILETIYFPNGQEAIKIGYPKQVVF